MFHCCLLVCVFDVLDVLQIDWIYKIGWSCRTTRGILRLNASVTQRSAAFFDVAALVSEAFTSVIIADIVLFFSGNILPHLFSMFNKKNEIVRSGGVEE